MTDSILASDIQLQRSDLTTIKDMIPDGASILDLGCGSGRLLKALQSLKHARVCGAEVDQNKVLECAARGVPVIHADLNDDLFEFSDNTFDYVILSRTIQAVKRPDILLQEMLRIGGHGIVSFLNFGHINARVQLLLGNMPVTGNLPLPWYDTPNIHPSTIADFRMLCREKHIRILREIPLTQPGDFLPCFSPVWPNLFASTCIFIIAK